MRRFVGIVGLLLCVVGSVVGIVGTPSPASAQVPGPDIAVSVTPTYPATGLPFVRRGESVLAAVRVANLGDAPTGAVSVRIETTKGFRLDTLADPAGFTCGVLILLPDRRSRLDCSIDGPAPPGAEGTIVVRATVIPEYWDCFSYWQCPAPNDARPALGLSASATTAGDIDSSNNAATISRPRAVDSIGPISDGVWQELAYGHVSIAAVQEGGLWALLGLRPVSSSVEASGVRVGWDGRQELKAPFQLSMVGIVFFNIGTSSIAPFLVVGSSSTCTASAYAVSGSFNDADGQRDGSCIRGPFPTF